MSDPVPTPPKNEDSPKGLVLAVTAYLMWGFLPLYMKALADVPVLEVLAHRVLWSVPVAGAILIWLGRTRDLQTALRSPRMIGMAALTAGLISVNWGIYVWSIQSGQALEAALGYYINPLFSIFLGRVLLGERMSRAQGAAIALAALAVAVLTWEAGRVPVIALGLTVSWGFYAYLKKRLPLGPNQGFMLEVLILSPLAAGWLVWIGAQGTMVFGADAWLTALLLCAGVVTAVPLMIYANGAKLLRLSTIGILQYIAPTMIFLTAVLVFDEPFGMARAVAFPMIWAALVIYTGSMIRRK
ncbi:EamA family transporter RarD [Rhodobacteraceae bacterium HSP-20]|uniref:EamA family transporter RarD n=1 Tax=Paragemmobacter amnigenus TaxID=2852097 RepID=A0ABS6J404_9RHOB|nr:EamA family transporter RarD [Rhodobacter amnigenus]MBU9698484.1 EamA family transporter RarD [Rhodobacter amnigenus]MBV4389711.1 EamA family transporter RarD [Rhodobacter amnigenus]